MATIRILPEQLANQIAAGEVVERPASVVKELVENSLDAGADRIEVEIEGGGTRLIRVLDNGSGMDEDDVLLAFERHGTSKISDVTDLGAISSLGFRGEAIPSIASVSKMSITSKNGEDPFGTMVVFEYGKLTKTHEVGCSQGTTIEVRNLFGNTPARKKFLRTARTEIGHIDEILKNYALASPNTTFILRVNTKESCVYNSGQDLEQRLRSILRYEGDFIEIGTKQPGRSRRHIYGLIVPPERTLASTARLRLFINGRAIRDRLMSHAVFEGLRGFLHKGHGAAGYLHITIPADEVDVNVHPAKHEVRFHNSGDIHQFIQSSVENGMRQYQHTIKDEIFKRHDSPPHASEPSPYPKGDPAPHASPLHKPDTSGTRGTTPLHTVAEEHSPYRNSPGKDSAPSSPFTNIPPLPHPERKQDQSAQSPEEGQFIGHGMRIIGQFSNLYIFCQSGDKLVVVDQHAAHERLLYEKYRSQYVSGKLVGQNLLFPQTIELSPFQIQIFEQNKEELSRLGFAVSEFGGSTYVINGVPAIAGKEDATTLFFDVLDGYGKQGEKSSPGGKIDDIIATMACKAAIKSGYELSIREIDELLNSMAKADLFSHCPHGRPVLKYFSENDLKKWFLRT